MKVVPVTHYYTYQNTLFPVLKKMDNPIYAAVPDVVSQDSAINYIKKDSLPWFETNSEVTFFIEKVRLIMIPLVGNTKEEVLELIAHYNQLATIHSLENSYKKS